MLCVVDSVKTYCELGMVFVLIQWNRLWACYYSVCVDSVKLAVSVVQCLCCFSETGCELGTVFVLLQWTSSVDFSNASQLRTVPVADSVKQMEGCMCCFQWQYFTCDLLLLPIISKCCIRDFRLSLQFQMHSDPLSFGIIITPVSYTHLTLPTTTYV